MTVHVKSLNAVIAAWALTHVGNEPLEAAPPFAHPNPASAVFLVG
jgi:hypothetical protein